MSIKLSINLEQYKYDVFQIVKLFYPFEDVNFVSENQDFEVEVQDEGVLIKGKEIQDYYARLQNNTLKEHIKVAVYKFFSKLTGKLHPWGTLVGIRPTKIASSLIHKGLDLEKVLEHYQQHFLVSKEKAQLCYDVAKNQEQYLRNDIKDISIYVGMPFCPTRCAYCSFAANGIRGKEALVEAYLDALKKEIHAIAVYIKEKGLNIESIYFGGGTPTSVNNEQFADILKSIHKNFITGSEIVEFTVEAGRPDSITKEKLMAMKEYGVTRISINPQSMNDKTLTTIGRIHTVEEVINKFNMARDLGFNNINMDIIVGLPGEGIEEVENTCREIFRLKPESLTVHGMSIKRASRLHEDLINDKYSNKLGMEELTKMFEVTRKTAQKLGMIPYYLYRQKNMVGNMENVGYTIKGLECIYNVKIMEENQVNIALGADAVTKVIFSEENRIERFANLKDVGEYVNRIDELIERKLALLDTVYKG
ncbi:coproporphyrinogen III oxidase [Clostridium thermarum]|uniref:coproporphyrinogen III oxidase n=1 Tax=Clostridium thermarum TaxID=1716543 RepID=UPI0013D59855|nr:coproporphyrinogen III oxidase [Clostridium thermarum]